MGRWGRQLPQLPDQWQQEVERRCRAVPQSRAAGETPGPISGDRQVHIPPWPWLGQSMKISSPSLLPHPSMSPNPQPLVAPPTRTRGGAAFAAGRVTGRLRTTSGPGHSPVGERTAGRRRHETAPAGWWTFPRRRSRGRGFPVHETLTNPWPIWSIFGNSSEANPPVFGAVSPQLRTNLFAKPEKARNNWRDWHVADPAKPGYQSGINPAAIQGPGTPT